MFSARSDFGRSKNRLELARAAAVSAGKTILDLTESNPTRAGLPCLEIALDALADRRGLSYQPDPFGLLSAREAVCELMAGQGVTVSPERVVLTSSTSEAYAFLFKLLCDPHDQVLVPSPSYPLFEHLAQLEDVRATSYPLAYDGRWHLPADALASARTKDSRAVVAVHPNNPT
ncbi:MAG: aminotransferase class I/II-fold pyridoxal phosphate-dependent enzyme, partial [Polyangiales bacterium]